MPTATKAPDTKLVRQCLARRMNCDERQLRRNRGGWQMTRSRHWCGGEPAVGAVWMDLTAAIVSAAEDDATKLHPASRQRTVAGSQGAAMAGRRRLDPKKGDEGLFGQHLESLVERAGLTVEEFARRIGKDRDTVTLYFSGNRLPKIKDFRTIASALGLDNIRDLIPDAPIANRKRRKT